MQQEEGQAFWINRGRAQQAQIVRAPITSRQTAEAWEVIRQQEEIQRAKLEPVGLMEREQQEQAKNRRVGQPAISHPQNSTTPDASSPTADEPSMSPKAHPLRTSEKETPKPHERKTTKTPAEDVSSTRKGLEASTSLSFPVSPPAQTQQSDVSPNGLRDDDGPDYL